MPVPSPGSSDDLSRGVICLYFPHLISFKISGSNPVLPQVFLGASGAPHPPCRESAEVRVCESRAGPRSSSQCARQGPCGETGRRGVAPAAEPAPLLPGGLTLASRSRLGPCRSVLTSRRDLLDFRGPRQVSTLCSVLAASAGSWGCEVGARRGVGGGGRTEGAQWGPAEPRGVWRAAGNRGAPGGSRLRGGWGDGGAQRGAPGHGDPGGDRAGTAVLWWWAAPAR